MGLNERKKERLNPVEVSRGVSRLRKSGLFSRVGYEYVGREEGSEQLHLRVHMEERKSARVDTAARFSTDELGQLRLDWGDRNFGGLMLDVGAGAGLGLFIGRRSDVNAHFRWPRFLGTNLDFSINPAINYIDRPQPSAPLVPDSLGRLRAKARWDTIKRWRIFDVGSRFSVDWNNPLNLLPGFAAGLDYEWRLEWNDPKGAPIPLAVPYSAGDFELRVPNLTAFSRVDGLVNTFLVPVNQIGVFTPRVRYTAIKNPFDPVSGWSAELAVKFGLDPWTLNSQNVVLVTSRLTTYLPLHNDVVLALNLRPWGGYGNVSDTRRSILLRPELLQLGGDRTVRGYRNTSQFGLIGLAEEVADGRHSSELFLLGVQANAELRWTVARNLGIGDLKLAFFTDAGLVTDDASALPFSSTFPWVHPARSYLKLAGRKQLGFSFGTGLRYVTPVGPASLDLAFAPLNDDNDFGRFVHIQFGYAF
jgi:outer membrane protein assembly factor BamA